MAQELDGFLSNKFGLTLMGGRVELPGKSRIEMSPKSLEKERELVAQIKARKEAKLALNTKDNLEFLMSLGSNSRVTLVLPDRRPQGSPWTVNATLTPDTNLLADRLRLAFIGRFKSGRAEVPPQYDPINPNQDKKSIDLYLSAANQMATVGEHVPGQRVSIVDPRHLLNAMAEFNIGSSANTAINSQDASVRPHISDVWERDRGMLPLISAQDFRNPQNDLIWAPITFTPQLSSESSAPLGVILTPDILDPVELARDKIVPLKANNPGALEEVQRLGFATLIQKDATDQLARRVEQRLI